MTETILTISPIGNPAATTREVFDSPDAARAELVARNPYGLHFRDEFSGTIGSLTGRVFQASSTWRIDGGR